MLIAAAPVMKAAPRGALCALGFGRVAVALGACVLTAMPQAGAGSCPLGGLEVALAAPNTWGEE
jgi:hypothetical protein